MSQLAIDATQWQTAEWARDKGLYTELFDSVDEMDKSIAKLVNTLANSNPEAMQMLKKVFWEGTEHWNELLLERAAMSGKLVLSDFTRKAINKFKKK
jgi:methylglutaconyl-CoA hydratase